MDTKNITYEEGLKRDGVARFEDSNGEVWLIPLEFPSGDFKRVVDEYLASLPKPLPSEKGSLIQVTKVVPSDLTASPPVGVYTPVGVYARLIPLQDSQETRPPWRHVTEEGAPRLYSDEIVEWNPVKIVDE